MHSNLLETYLNDKLIGFLKQDEGNLEFQYAPDATQAISLSMPLREEEYKNKHCRHFFDNLLPEDEKAKMAIAKIFGATNYNNPFSMLRAIGQECAGAISFFEPGEKEKHDAKNETDLEYLTESRLADLIDELPSKPLFAGEDGVRISLAGVQEKAPVIVDENGIALPKDRPSTHILKPAIKDFKDSALNEFLTMELAKKVKVIAADVELRSAKGREYLLVKRYDRETIKNKSTRIHQEDFCQAMNIPAASKYQNDGGPSFKTCFQLLNQTTIPATNKLQMLRFTVFNYLVGNADAHGKNFSLLHRSPTDISLAPLYDSMCISVQKSFSTKMAMRIGKEEDLNRVTESDWRYFADDAEMNFKSIESEVNDQTGDILNILEEKKTDKGYELAWTKEVERRCRKARKVLLLD